MIKELLFARHREDICVGECKTGASWTGPRVGIIDFWAMKKSWQSPAIYGYEIKVSRNDFVRDDKWKQYMDYCNLFYFVAPQGIIEPGELPDGVGLVVTSINCKKLYLKRKAAFRDVAIPESLWRYLLMWRAEITSEKHHWQTRKEYWAEWMKDKDENKSFGHIVAHNLSELIRTRITKAEERSDRLEKRQVALVKVEELCHKLDINPEYEYDIERKLREKLRLIPEHFAGQMDRTIDSLKELKEMIRKVEEAPVADDVPES
jgi:hypothetical protein